MKVITVKNYQQLSATAASIFAKELLANPELIIGLATGSTPVGMYQFLTEKNMDFSRVISFNLDEYVGLSPNHKQSYHYFMQKNFFDGINIGKENHHIPFGDAEDLTAECESYDCCIRYYGGIDLQILGIGSNGHIGFNEPDTDFSYGTHVVNLKNQTVKDNAAKYFKSNMELVPKQALSMGTIQILEAKKIILLASGISKSKAIFDMFGKITPKYPASILQEHADVTLIIDEDAASLL